MFVVQLLILQVFIFVGLVLVLRQLLARHATTATAHLQTLSVEYMRKQEELKKRLEEAERRYQQQIAKAQEEGQQLKARALQDAETVRQQTLDQAHQEAERIVQQAAQARESLQQELVQSMDARAVERACELIQGALPDELHEAMHAQWVEALIHNGLIASEHLPKIEPGQAAKVTSAFPLTAAQRKLLTERVRAAVGGTEVALEERVDPKLVAGLTITLGHLVFDGSLSSKLLEAVRRSEHAARGGP